MTDQLFDPLSILQLEHQIPVATTTPNRPNVPAPQLIPGINPANLGLFNPTNIFGTHVTTPDPKPSPSVIPQANVLLGNNAAAFQFQPGGQLETTNNEFTLNIARQERALLMNVERKMQTELPRYAVESLKISSFSDNEILELSVVEIRNTDLEGMGSVNDPSMGTINDKFACPTCHRSKERCPGHYGHIKLHDPKNPLSEPFYNYLKFPPLLKILTCVCHSCGGLLLTEKEIEDRGLLKYTGETRLKMLTEECKGEPCRRGVGCGNKQITIIPPAKYPFTDPKVPRNKIVVPAATCIINPGPHCEIPKIHPEQLSPKQVQTQHLVQGNPQTTILPNLIRDPVAQSPGLQVTLLPMTPIPGPIAITAPNTDFLKDLPMGEIKKCIPNSEIQIKKSKDSTRVLVKNPDDESRAMELPIKCVASILDNISDEDSYLMGFGIGDHPRRFIMSYLLVPPPCIRAPVYQDGSAYPDHLTTIYKDIVQKVSNLRLEKDPRKRRDIYDGLVFILKHLINNTDGKLSQGQQGALTTLYKRLVGKTGVIRGFLQGKRVNFSARSVITPNPYMRINQIGIPRVWAPFLTKPVTATSVNKAELQSLLRSGKVIRITAGSGDKKGHQMRVNDNMRKNYIVNVGDKVERWLQNGDYVLFNRAPTLHKYGIMGHEVVLQDALTAQLHPSVTPPYNADFDGDEMNIHVPQTAAAELEIKTIMNVNSCIMNSQTNSPIIGLIMDNIVAANMLSRPDTFINPDTFNDAILRITAKDSLATLDRRLDLFRMRPQQDYAGNLHIPGKVLFSALLPEDFSYTKGSVVVINGIMIQGILTKSHVGKSSNSIIQALWKNYGMARTAQFLDDAGAVLTRFMIDVGFSVGLGDCFPKDPNTRKMVEDEITKTKMQVAALGEKPIDPIEQQRHEDRIVGIVNVSKTLGQKLSKQNLAPDNAFQIMIGAGAKGGYFNMAQIMASLTQVFVRGKRPAMGFDGGKRCLPYFSPGEKTLESRGFCSSSFLTGLGPAEMFFHLMAGRVGLLETAVSTAGIGAIHREMVKTLEDLKVLMDGSVRNSANKIVQFVYGDDGLEGAELINVKSPSGNVDQRYPFFVDLEQEIFRINAKHGYYQNPAGEDYKIQIEFPEGAEPIELLLPEGVVIEPPEELELELEPKYIPMPGTDDDNILFTNTIGNLGFSAKTGLIEEQDVKVIN